MPQPFMPGIPPGSPAAQWLQPPVYPEPQPVQQVVPQAVPRPITVDIPRFRDGTPAPPPPAIAARPPLAMQGGPPPPPPPGDPRAERVAQGLSPRTGGCKPVTLIPRTAIEEAHAREVERVARAAEQEAAGVPRDGVLRITGTAEGKAPPSAQQYVQCWNRWAANRTAAPPAGQPGGDGEDSGWVVYEPPSGHVPGSGAAPSGHQ